MMIVPVEGGEVHVYDNIVGPDGWHLWMALLENGQIIATDETCIVSESDDDSLKQAAERFAKQVRIK